MSEHAMETILNQAAQISLPVTINATNSARAHLIWETRTYPKSIIAADLAQLQTLWEMAGLPDTARLHHVLNARCILITDTPNGWNLTGETGLNTGSAGPTVPDHTDFIGCGDYAAAGLTCAIVEARPIIDTVNQFIAYRMELNRLPPP